MEEIECSETSAYTNQTPGNHPKENKQQSLYCYRDILLFLISLFHTNKAFAVVLWTNSYSKFYALREVLSPSEFSLQTVTINSKSENPNLFFEHSAYNNYNYM